MNDQNVVSVRLSGLDAELIQAAADRAGVTVSAYLRDAATRAAFRDRPVDFGRTEVKTLRGGGELLWWSPTPHVFS